MWDSQKAEGAFGSPAGRERKTQKKEGTSWKWDFLPFSKNKTTIVKSYQVSFLQVLLPLLI